MRDTRKALSTVQLLMDNGQVISFDSPLTKKEILARRANAALDGDKTFIIDATVTNVTKENIDTIENVVFSDKLQFMSVFEHNTSGIVLATHKGVQ